MSLDILKSMEERQREIIRSCNFILQNTTEIKISPSAINEIIRINLDAHASLENVRHWISEYSQKHNSNSQIC